MRTASSYATDAKSYADIPITPSPNFLKKYDFPRLTPQGCRRRRTFRNPDAGNGRQARNPPQETYTARRMGATERHTTDVATQRNRLGTDATGSNGMLSENGLRNSFAPTAIYRHPGTGKPSATAGTTVAGKCAGEHLHRQSRDRRHLGTRPRIHHRRGYRRMASARFPIQRMGRKVRGTARQCHQRRTLPPGSAAGAL